MRRRFFRTCVISLAPLLILALPVLPSPASAQGDKFLTRLEGSWEGEGKAFGMTAHLRIGWKWVLESKFMRLSLKNEMSAPDGRKQVFEGQAFYRSAGAGKYEAHWFDSRGITFPIKAQLDGDTLVASWGSPETEEGKSSYRLVDEGTLEVVDSVRQKDGTMREFSRVILKRR